MRLALIGEFDPAFPPHAATATACRHSAAALRIEVESAWVSTADLTPDTARDFAGLWVLPGSPYKSLANTLAVIRVAREEGVPCLGTCGGFQHMVLEYARHVLGVDDAQHAEYDPYASNLFVTALACSLKGREMQLKFARDSLVASIYGSETAVEEYYCDFGVDPAKVDLLSSRDLRISGSDAEGAARVIELPAHPFFVGTLYVPQMRSTADRPHPLVTAFLLAAKNRR
jgi:CTP synthase (UTP-ammonia lyase)